ncbi:MAG: bifunctional riboflavin kinase/FAD synthetase [Desulfitobacterium hafniense]|nr:bifunctional riboflavin kinase/FAD synthetase [Desulfitobacterium hafniense]
MQVFTEVPLNAEPCVLALGNFDGVHIGHRRLLRSGLEKAKQLGIKMCVLVFQPHPLKLLAPDRRVEYLTTQEERIRIFETIGIDKLFILPFNYTMADKSPESFIKDVIIPLGASHIVVGFNYSFGSQGKGTPFDLQELGQRYGFAVSILQAQTIDGKVISSSSIRKALSQGDISTAAKMLGRYPSLSGAVIKGEQRGRVLGFPTANINPSEEILIPKRGVYAVQVSRGANSYFGMMNIGMKPTFHNFYVRTIEVHLFDFNEKIYGEKLLIRIVERLRDEKKFNDIKELRAQLEKDAQDSLKVLTSMDLR